MDFDELLDQILDCSSRKSGSPIAPSNQLRLDDEYLED